MRTIRIFISSPGDVSDERDRARQVIESLRRRYLRQFLLKHLMWEDLPLEPNMSFQEGIDLVLSDEHGVDIAVFILWSRLGTPLGSAIRKPDGAAYRSGTEREYELMMRARAQSSQAPGADGTTERPRILVYTRSDQVSFDERLRNRSTQEQEELIRQKKLVEAFISEEFQDADSGTSTGAHHGFDRPGVFSQRLRAHLVDLLDGMAGGAALETIWDIETQGPPFMGLSAFQPRHAAVFFGREEEILESRRALGEQARNGCAFLLLTGASGSGKSSLARAGVLPAIVENEIDGQVAAWRTLIVVPSELTTDPKGPAETNGATNDVDDNALISALVRRLAADGVLPELRAAHANLDDLVQAFRRNPGDAVALQIKPALARAGRSHQGGAVRLLLVLDQLEEIFASMLVSGAHRTEFFAVVEALARGGGVWVMATVRSDFFERVQNEPALARMKSGLGQIDVLPPGADALRRLVEEPARLAGLRYEERDGQSLSDRILRQAVDHPELLPLVEDLLRELFEKRAGRVLTFEAYESLGGVEGALAQRANQVFQALAPDAQDSLPFVLQALVTLGEDLKNDTAQAGAATVVALGEARVVRQHAPLHTFAGNPAAGQLVEAFRAARLFTASKDRDTGEANVTVAHESLLRVWPIARDWADRNRSFLRTRASLVTRIKEGSPLLKGDPLLELASSHLARNPEGFSSKQREFIAASIRNSRRQKIRIWSTAAFAGAAVLAILFYLSYRQTQNALAGQLAAEAKRHLSVKDYTRAEISAARSLTYLDDPETRETLLDARGGGVSLISRSLERMPSSALSVFSPDSKMMATVITGDAGSPSRVAIAPSSGGPDMWSIGLTREEALVETMVLSDADGSARRFALARPDHSVAVWVLEDGKPAGPPHELLDNNKPVHTKRVPSLAFHPSKPWIATSSEDRSLCLWDYSREPAQLIWRKEGTHGTAVHGIAFNADGTLLASGGGDYLVDIWETDKMTAGYAGHSRPTGHEIEPLTKLEGHVDSVFSVAFSPDGTRLASGGFDRVIRVWDLSGCCKRGADGHFPPVPADGFKVPTVAMLNGHSGNVLALAFSHDSKLVISGGKDATLRVWDISQSGLLTTMTPETGVIRSVARSVDEELHAGGESGWSTWSTRGRPLVRRLWTGATVQAIAFDPAGKFLVASGNDGKVRIWDRDYRSAELTIGREGDSINALAFSADGKWLAAAGEKGIIHLWQRGADEKTWTAADAAVAPKHNGAIWGLCFDPQGNYLVSSNADKNMRLRRWRLTDWSMMDESEPLKDTVYSIACEAGGRRLITGDSNARVAVRNTDDLRVIDQVINVTQGDISTWSVGTAPPSFIFSGNSDGRVYRWLPDDPEWTSGGKPEKIGTSDADAAVNHTINSVSYSQKYGWLAAGGDGASVEIYDINLKHLRSLRGQTGTIWFVSFDNDGSRLAYGGLDRILVVWSVDEIERNLKLDAPNKLYKEAQEMTGLSVESDKIVMKALVQPNAGSAGNSQ